MIFAKYQRYKDSGIKWLGEIPQTWEIKRLNEMARVLAGFAFESDSFSTDGVPVIRMSDFGNGRIFREDVKFVSSETVPPSAYGKQDDILLGLSGSIGNFAVIKFDDLPLAINQRVAIVRCENEWKNLLPWLLQSAEFKKQIESQLPATTIQNVSMEQLRKLMFPLPSNKEEIQKISQFLQHETSKIDSLIAEQEKLINFLREKHRATISHAVTTGLNSDIKLIHSGIEWINKIPAHWEIKPIRAVASVNDEVLSENTDSEYEIIYVDIGSVSISEGIRSTENYKFTNAPSRARRIVRKGDVIVSTVRTYLRAIAFIDNPPENMIVSTGFAVIRPKASLTPEFAKFSLQSENFIGEVISKSTGVSYPAINASEISRIKLPIPPISEQHVIAEYLEKETAKIEKLTEEATTVINLLRERRAALISASITGQIDVRNFQNEMEVA